MIYTFVYKAINQGNGSISMPFRLLLLPCLNTYQKKPSFGAPSLQIWAGFKTHKVLQR